MHSLYKETLMDHYRYPRNKGDLKDADVLRRGSNPRCGDQIEIGLTLKGETLEWVGFRGRGCAVCIASASMMTEAVTGKTTDDSLVLYQEIKHLFGHDGAGSVGEGAGDLGALLSVRKHPARRDCVMLSWNALSEALAELEPA